MTQIAITLQIATFDRDDQGGIIAGIKNFPIHKLALLCYDTDKHKAEEFTRRLACTPHRSNYQYSCKSKCH